MSALAVHDGAVGIMVFDIMVIEYLSVLFPRPDLASTHTHGLNRIGILEPVHHVDVVNVLFNDVFAAKPVEIIPVSPLVFHFALTGLPLINPNAVAVPVHLTGSDVTNHSVACSFYEFAIGILVVTLQSYHDIEFLLFRDCSHFKNLLHTSRVCRHRFFHKDVLTLLDGLLKMYRTESGRRSQDDDVGEGYGLKIRVEANELRVFGYAYSILYGYAVVIFRCDGFQTVIDPVAKSICHCHQFYILMRQQCLACGACSTPSAPD